MNKFWVNFDFFILRGLTGSVALVFESILLSDKGDWTCQGEGVDLRISFNLVINRKYIKISFRFRYRIQTVCGRISWGYCCIWMDECVRAACVLCCVCAFDQAQSPEWIAIIDKRWDWFLWWILIIYIAWGQRKGEDINSMISFGKPNHYYRNKLPSVW